jgi:DNA polymerase (family 10)
MAMTDYNLLKILSNISKLLEIKGENQFKARAYSNAARYIHENDIDIEKAVRNGTLEEIPGVGRALKEKISDYVENGEMEYYRRLTAEVPESLLEITKIGNLGAKRVGKIYRHLGIETLEQLEKACNDGTLENMKGFGPRFIEIILNGIRHRKASRGRFINQQSLALTEDILEELKNDDNVSLISTAGQTRRFGELVERMDYVATAESDKKLIDVLVRNNIKAAADGSVSGETPNGIPVRIKNVPRRDFYWRLHSETGSEEYIGAFIEYACKKGYEADSEELRKNGERIAFESEEKIYDLLGLQYVPPELREFAFAADRAAEGKIPRLIEKSDLRGMLHVHSDWSDGRDTLLDMVRAAENLGFGYFAICDHSRTAGYAHGLSIERVIEQQNEIDRITARGLVGIPVLKGIESDILKDGSLDYPEEILRQFDIIVASIHSNFRMDKEEMTRRIIKAVENPYTTILGHPSGRLLSVRPAYEIDVRRVIDAAVANGKIIEINSNPYRLDLDWRNAIYAKEKGLKMAINPDSHQTRTLTDVFYGINVARKGWLEPSDVVNCLEYEDFAEKYVKIWQK